METRSTLHIPRKNFPTNGWRRYAGRSIAKVLPFSFFFLFLECASFPSLECADSHALAYSRTRPAHVASTVHLVSPLYLDPLRFACTLSRTCPHPRDLLSSPLQDKYLYRERPLRHCEISRQLLLLSIKVSRPPFLSLLTLSRFYTWNSHQRQREGGEKSHDRNL